MPHSSADLLAGIPMPLVLIGADRAILAANAPARALFGLGDAGLGDTGRAYGLFLRQPDLQTAIETALRARTPGQIRLISPGNGPDRVHEVTITPQDGGALLAFVDLTAAEQMDQMRRDFIANVSHELRTPLTALIGFIDTLQGTARDDAPARQRFLTIMATEAQRMSRLVRDLLRLSRVEAEERTPPQTTVDLAGLLRGVVDTLGAQGVRVQGADLPQLLRADSDQMVQMMTNLIENALKYGGPGTEVTLAREEGPRGPQLRLAVQDHGPGIDPRHIPRLTERFYRIDNHRSREMGGTGLGLAIVKHIVQRHKGRLIIESAAGTGSKFSVLLPIT